MYTHACMCANCLELSAPHMKGTHQMFVGYMLNEYEGKRGNQEMRSYNFGYSSLFITCHDFP